MAIYSEFSHQKLWFSIATLNYQRVNHPFLGTNTAISRKNAEGAVAICATKACANLASAEVMPCRAPALRATRPATCSGPWVALGGHGQVMRKIHEGLIKMIPKWHENDTETIEKWSESTEAEYEKEMFDHMKMMIDNDLI